MKPGKFPRARLLSSWAICMTLLSGCASSVVPLDGPYSSPASGDACLEVGTEYTLLREDGDLALSKTRRYWGARPVDTSPTDQTMSWEISVEPRCEIPLRVTKVFVRAARSSLSQDDDCAQPGDSLLFSNVHRLQRECRMLSLN